MNRTKNLQSNRTAPALALAAALLALSAPAGAGDTVKLRYNSAELDSTFHAARLYRRIERLAESHCTTAGRRSLHRMTLEQQCMSEVLERVIDKVDSRTLSAIHEEKQNGRKFASL